jgi:hypothetical protein
MVFHADDVAEVKVTSVCGSAAANQDVATFRLGKVPHSRQRQRTPLLVSTALYKLTILQSPSNSSIIQDEVRCYPRIGPGRVCRHQQRGMRLSPVTVSVH